MKAFLTLFVGSLFFGPIVHAQHSPSISLNLSNTNLIKIGDTLKKLYGILLSYPEHPEKYSPINLHVEHATLDELMKQTVSGFPLDYRILRHGDLLSPVIFESSAAPRWKYATLPRDTLRPVFTNGYDQGGAAGNVASYGTVNAEQLERAVGRSLLDHLEGQVNGLTNGGQNNNLGFSIRGNTTLLGSGTPLVAVGPFAFSANIEDINIYDLRSVTVLKDAAAAGVWGAYSGNGVLELTPKEGAYNKSREISFIINTTVMEKPNLFYPPRMSSGSYINADSILFSKGYFDQYINNPLFALPPSVVELLQARQGLISSGAADAAIASMAKHNLTQDLDRYYYRTSAVQQYHLSMEGGTCGYKYYVAGGYDRDPTDLVRNRWQRSTLNGSYTTRSDDGKWEGAASGNLAVVNTLNNNTGDVPVAYPYAQLADAAGHPLPVSYQFNPLFVDTVTNSYPQSWAYTPLQELALADNRSTRVDFYLQGILSYRFRHGWTAEVSGRWTHGHSYSRDTYNKDSYFVRSLVNAYSQPQENGFLLPIPDDNILVSADTTLYGYNARAKLKFCDTTTSAIWSMMGGAEVSDAETSGQTQRFYGYNSPTNSTPMDLADLFPLRPAGQNTIPTNDALIDWSSRAVSIFSSAACTWKRNYNFYSAFRLDASNIVGVTNARKWAPFWSLGASRMFRLGERASTLKVRLGFGCNGNVSNRTADLATEYLGLNNYGAQQVSVTAPPDPTLGWERVYTLNAGVDVHVLRDSISPHGRLWGSFDLYQRWAVNLLCYDTLAPSAGVSAYMGNAAAITGQGIEFSLHSINIIVPHKFYWLSSLLVGFNRDWVSRYPYTAKSPSSYVTLGFAEKGKPSTALYSYGWAGLDPKNGDPRGWLGGSYSTAYTGLMNDPSATKVFSGDWQPKVTTSLLNDVGLGRWVLSVGLDCRTGYVVRRPSIEYYYLASNFYRGTRDYDDRWQYAGEKTSVPSMPDTLNANRDDFYANSQILITRADNIRLRDLKISYKWIFKKSPLKSVVLYVYCNNIATLWKANHYGVDPDAPIYGELPVSRSYSLGAHFTM